MTNHTPTTEEVREQYTREHPPRIGTFSGRVTEFDRWLAQHEREVAAEALREAAVEIEANADPMGDPDPAWLAGMESAASRVRDLADRIEQGGL